MNKDFKILVGTKTIFSDSGELIKTFKSTEIEYSINGQIIKKTVFADNGSVNNIVNYNDKGEIKEEIVYKDANSVNYRYNYKMDDTSRVIKEMYLGKGVYHGRSIILSDEAGRPVKEEFYDSQNSLKATDTYTYLDNGKVIKDREGLGQWEYRYDNHDNLIYCEGGLFSDDRMTVIEYSYFQNIFPLTEKKYYSDEAGKVLLEAEEFKFID
jgi:antitoxin component YwqK of YwqJK toxin-antitoxin module